jgi:hypothetical protein
MGSPSAIGRRRLRVTTETQSLPARSARHPEFLSFIGFTDTVTAVGARARRLRRGIPDVPRRKIPVSAAKAAPGARKEQSRRKVDTILARRDRLVAEMAVLRDRGDASRFINNAQQLMTRWWSTATWNAREELLKTAEWLVRLAKRRGAQSRA